MKILINKYALFLVFILSPVFLFANPRETYPSTPDAVYQNDLDLRDMIDSRIKNLNADGYNVIGIGEISDGSTTYFRIDAENGAPPSGACDSDTERGRLYLDYSGGSGAIKLYICTGAATGWDYVTLTD